jgi:hypothetical protein
MKIPAIRFEVWNRVNMDVVKGDGLVETTKLLQVEQPEIMPGIAVNGLANPAMFMGFCVCYVLISEQMKANEVAELEKLVR